MKRRLWFLVAAAIVASVAAVWFVDPFWIQALAVVGLVWIGFPATVVGGFQLRFFAVSAPLRRHWRSAVHGVAAFTCWLALVIPANSYVHERAVEAAKAYPAQVAPLLETYRQTHGSYPKSLDLLPSKPALPRLLRGSRGYRIEDDGYSFSFETPGDMFGAWYYDSRKRTWILFT